MKMDYKELLKRARSQLPQEVFEHKRFELPKVRSTVIGMRTIIFNFKEICDYMNRDSHHVLRFLSKEMATSATAEGSRVFFKGKFPYETLEGLIKRYADEFVICPICKRPDTKIVKERRLYFLICEACGARSSVRPV